MALDVTDCTISGNSGTDGGLSVGSGTVTGCTISGNTGNGGGGGVSNYGTLALTDCTISGNSTVGPGGGLDNGEKRYGDFDRLHDQRQLQQAADW